MNQNSASRLRMGPTTPTRSRIGSQPDEPAPVRDDDPVEEAEDPGPRLVDLIDDHARILARGPGCRTPRAVRAARRAGDAACGGRPCAPDPSSSSRRGRASSPGDRRRRRRVAGVRAGPRARRSRPGPRRLPGDADAITGRSRRFSSHWIGTVRAPFTWSRSRSSRSFVTASTCVAPVGPDPACIAASDVRSRITSSPVRRPA